MKLKGQASSPSDATPPKLSCLLILPKQVYLLETKYSNTLVDEDHSHSKYHRPYEYSSLESSTQIHQHSDKYSAIPLHYFFFLAWVFFSCTLCKPGMTRCYSKLYWIVPYSCLAKSIDDLLTLSGSRKHSAWLLKWLKVGGGNTELSYTSLNFNWKLIIRHQGVKALLRR